MVDMGITNTSRAILARTGYLLDFGIHHIRISKSSVNALRFFMRYLSNSGLDSTTPFDA